MIYWHRHRFEDVLHRWLLVVYRIRANMICSNAISQVSIHAIRLNAISQVSIRRANMIHSNAISQVSIRGPIR